jgi:thymidine kinase
MSLSFTPSIDIIFGPMLASKTTEVIRRLIVYHELDMKVLYVNSVLDTRSDGAFSTHNATIGKIPFDTAKVFTLSEVDVEPYDVIAIDESQFFTDLKKCVLAWVEKQNKIVIVAGLNGDFKRQNFGQINDLIPFCDTVTKLAPFCISCKKGKNVIRTAIFSKRIVESKEEVLIGGKETYIPVCRECYLN